MSFEMNCYGKFQEMSYWWDCSLPWLL